MSTAAPGSDGGAVATVPAVAALTGLSGSGGERGPVPPVALLRDVARLAGVSRMTVSRVLNGTAPVSGDTRARVLDAVAALDYRPNPAARTLSSGRSRTIGVITLEGGVLGPASTLAGIEHEARDAGYATSVAILHELTSAAVAEAAGALRSVAVEGIIVSAPWTELDDSLLQPRQVPMVAVEGFGGDLPVVAVDQHLGAVLATRHLVAAGHRVVAHIAGPEDRYEALERHDGWRDTLVVSGLVPGPAVRGDWSPSSGHTLALQLLADPAVTAVFAANDQMALGVLRACTELGRRVPHDLAVVGFDDIPEAAYLTPSLTTVRYDFHELGRRTVQRLLAELAHPAGAERSAEGERTVIAPTLVVRESTGRAC